MGEGRDPAGPAAGIPAYVAGTVPLGEPVYREYPTLQKQVGGRVHDALYLAEKAVPGTMIRAGDLVIYGRYLNRRLNRRERDAIKGEVLRLPRASFPALVASLHLLRLIHPEDRLFSVVGFPRVRVTRRGILQRYLQIGAKRSGRDETSPILVVRPWASPVSQAIQAGSDEAALFELLCQVGGVMPKED